MTERQFFLGAKSKTDFCPLQRFMRNRCLTGVSQVYVDKKKDNRSDWDHYSDPDYILYRCIRDINCRLDSPRHLPKITDTLQTQSYFVLVVHRDIYWQPAVG
jgi:hypothetical protein